MTEIANPILHLGELIAVTEVEAPTLTGALTGNASTATLAATATALATARTIFGQSFNGTGNVTGAVMATAEALTGVYDQSFGATVNNVAVGDVGVYRANPTVDGAVVNGIVPTRDGQKLLFINVSTTNNTGLGHEAAGSTAANRILCPNATEFVVTPYDAVWLWYDGTSDRWRTVFKV